MLTPEDVRALAVECGLAEWADELVATVYGWWQLEPRPDSEPAALGASKIGGGADLADGEEWPVNARGVPMTFLAQIDLRSLEPMESPWSPAAPLPQEGLLRLFADLIDAPVEPCPGRALVCPNDAALRRAPTPTPASWIPGGPYPAGGDEERYWALSETPVRLWARLSAHQTHPTLRPSRDDITPTARSYGNWVERLRLDGDPVPPEFPGPPVQHALLENPDLGANEPRDMGELIQDSPTLLTPPAPPADAWHPLLTLTHDNTINMPIADGGDFVLLVDRLALARGEYRLVCDAVTA